MVKFYIDEKGTVMRDSIRIERGNPIFEKSVIEAVAESEWEPAMLKGKKVGISLTIPIKFQLK